ncbi:KRI1-like family domain-containing protein [Trichoderma breve]|uniref:KRI1-like family domain-containing protein n=1 Tax=Trichoderma breve TaxID=2034170 RepID=A0A9W9E5R2_9HYPO|nr:KRI1-like family domain-containing protein [Trichoderma breve]KAJ4858440.1 KRI1-like family domain-containing protein [Trichoderma breve]
MAGPHAAATKDKPSNPNKRKLLDDSDSDSDDGAAIGSSSFKVNEEYARRFEHNKKREEKQRLEEKIKREEENDDSSSTDETEDEDGFLATEDLDAQISATLQAIRNKDPRVYDKDITFYQPEDENAEATTKEKKEKPVFLRDYQREKLLRGDVGGSDDEEEAPKTYQQEQDAIKKSLLSEIDAAKAEDSDEDDEDEDGFIKRKAPAQTDSNGLHPSRAKAVKLSEVDVNNADRDPETFLSNFMAARAWVADEGSRWEAFESDDGEEDNRAEEFEQAYNLRFEDPEKSNEVLKSYARDFAAARSVRREEKTGRKRQRELEREKKEAEKEQLREDKARLRKLKLEETEGKLRKIKQAAGAFGKELTDEQWMKFLDDAWENDKWEDDDEMDVDEEDGSKSKKKKPKKPKWDDDIDINDIIPDFEAGDEKPKISLSDDEAQDGDDDDEDEPSAKKLKSSDHKKARQETQKKARQERTKLEALVDSKMHLTDHDVLKGEGSGGFRYRETSPQAFGLTARDILLAPSDKVLNEFAGLKKLATFRDVEKKRKDRKHLGKKARLRQWRRDVFGGEFEHTGPTYGFERVVAKEDGEEEDLKEKRRREKKSKSKAAEGEGASNIIGDVDGTRKKRKRSKGKKAAKGESES